MAGRLIYGFMGVGMYYNVGFDEISRSKSWGKLRVWCDFKLRVGIVSPRIEVGLFTLQQVPHICGLIYVCHLNFFMLI